MRLSKILYLTPLMMLCACEGTFKEKTNDNLDASYIWRIPDLAEGVLNKVYKSFSARPDTYGGDNFLDAATDNAMTITSGSIKNLVSGTISTNSNPLDNWSSCYTNIQTVNLFLENGLSDDIEYDRSNEVNNAQHKERLEGEAHFLRAYFTFKMLQNYGGKSENGEALGVPLATSFITEEEAADLQNYKRDSYEDCIAQILYDCNRAIELLPATYAGSSTIGGVTQVGRASGNAARALKSRVALYGASPAYQSDEVTQIIGMGKFVVTDEATYQKKWVRAMGASWDAIVANGKKFTPLTSALLADGEATTPSEFIFRNYANSNAMEKSHFPPYYFGDANTVPSQNLVDAFPMANGYPIGRSEANYSEDAPYVGRDVRFGLNIYYHGATFGTGGTTTIDVTEDGKDSPQAHHLGSRTGYYLAKFLSKKPTLLTPTSSANSIHYNPTFRSTEAFLNFAEASNEAFGPMGIGSYESDIDGMPVDCDMTAFDAIKMIRELSGGICVGTTDPYLEEMATSKESMRELIANERRIELAFENHRYYDMRRCLMVLNEPVRGVVVTEENGLTSYDTTKVVEQRQFNGTGYYYLPLPYNEVLKGLENNLGWRK